MTDEPMTDEPMTDEDAMDGLRFWKMEGLGNDFVVLEGPREVDGGLVRSLCDRRRGIGADGVLVVTPVADDRVAMTYLNADGTPAEMCGNGLRCVAAFARARRLVDRDAFFVDTAVGPRRVIVDPDAVTVELGPVEVGEEDVEVAGVSVRPASVGNPHAVLFVDDPASAPVSSLGPRLGADPSFPDGVNVEFVRVLGPDAVEVRVWERGVGETLACGTGAAATAAVCRAVGAVGDDVTVYLPGGAARVHLDEDGTAWLTGPARFVFEGVWR